MRYPSPHQPRLVRALNWAGAQAARASLRQNPLSAEALMAAAIRRTGLEDFGEPSFRTGLEHLVASLEDEARLSLVGRIATRQMLTENLSHRLRLVDYRKQHPEVARQVIRRPLMIMGLPRTGTTILFELLAQDPAHRSPASWEVAEPLPPARAENYHTDLRIARVDKAFEQFESLAPGFKAIHELGATLPQECLAIMATQFMSEQYGANYHIPSYRHWYFNQDMTNTYCWHRQFLQHMQSGMARPRWVLKTPPHMAFLDALLTVYPDAALVHTHRDPMAVMASVSSLACTAHGAFSDRIDPVVTAEVEVRHFAAMLQRGMERRATLPDASGRFFDIHFEEIISAPIAAIERMYAHFGFDFTPEARQAMSAYLDRRPRDKHGAHHYSLEQFGISRERHGALFADYCKHFNL